MKNPLTPAGIEPANFRFVAQHLNHCATAVLNVIWVVDQIEEHWVEQETNVTFWQYKNCENKAGNARTLGAFHCTSYVPRYIFLHNNCVM